MKGVVGNFGARQAYNAALELEEASRNGNLGVLDGGVAALEDQIRKVRDELVQLVSAGEQAHEGSDCRG